MMRKLTLMERLIGTATFDQDVKNYGEQPALVQTHGAEVTMVVNKIDNGWLVTITEPYGGRTRLQFYPDLNALSVGIVNTVTADKITGRTPSQMATLYGGATAAPSNSPY